MSALLTKESNSFHVVNKIDPSIDMAVATAKAYPRNIDECIKEAMELISIDRETAESCFYCVPRGGKEIKGPSIRLAEIVAYCWGNLKAATRIIGNDGHFLTAESVCIDLQKNITISAEIKRSIRNKEGKQYNADMIQTTGNAACSLALRNAIFRVIPKHIINKLDALARQVAVGDAKSLPELRQKGLAWFSKCGITADKILNYYGVESVDQITLENIESMLGIKNSIRDGMVSIENAFSKNETVESSNVSEANQKLGVVEPPVNTQTNDEWLKDFNEEKQ